jgi:NAD(P)-dependent dehydrogenase (short-subunit alcohol dehydrogenase family)
MALGQLHALQGESDVAGMVADVRRYEECRSVVQEAATRFGRLDILGNNAGVGIFKSLDQLTAEEWDATIQTNQHPLLRNARLAPAESPGLRSSLRSPLWCTFGHVLVSKIHLVPR